MKEVPYSFQGADGLPIDTRSLIREEVITQTQVTPCDISESRHGVDPVTRRGTFIVSFLQPVRPFRLFSASAQSQLVSKKPRLILHDPGCQGYCRGASCKRVHRCNRCGERLDSHTPGECLAPIKCANCCGPYRVGHDECPAKPTFRDGRWLPPSKKTRAAIRLNGHRLFDLAHPATDPEDEGSQPLPTSSAEKRAPSPTETTIHTPPSAPTNAPTPTPPAEGTGTAIDTPAATTATPAAAATLPVARRNTAALTALTPRVISKGNRNTRTRPTRTGAVEYNEANRFAALLGDSLTQESEGQDTTEDTDMGDPIDSTIIVTTTSQMRVRFSRISEY